MSDGNSSHSSEVQRLDGRFRIGLLGNPNSTTYLPVRESAQDAARKAGLLLVPIEARSPQEIENALAAFATGRVPAVMVAQDAIFFEQMQRIAELAVSNRLATMFTQREYVVAGGLMSYGENLADFFHRAASYVDKIFKGARPAELPIEQPTQFHLVINRKTAHALGLTNHGRDVSFVPKADIYSAANCSLIDHLGDATTRFHQRNCWFGGCLAGCHAGARVGNTGGRMA
jgi:ABC-type uncharacterized transport system substrate-binding protein